VASILVLILWTLTNTQGTAVAFCVLFGAVSGAVIGLPPASIAFILGRSDPLKQAKLGHWTGMMYTMAASFAMTGPVIVGYLYGEYGIQSYVLQGFCGGCLLLGSACMLVAKCYTGPLRMARAIAKAREIKGSIVSFMSRDVSRNRSQVDLNVDLNEQVEKA
jgi:MCP family monocarboxylic acid transporter-like MFS transporter 10